MKTKTPNSAFGIGRQVQRRIAPRTLSFPKTGGTSVSARTLSPMKPGIAFEPQVFSPSGVEDRRNQADSTLPERVGANKSRQSERTFGTARSSPRFWADSGSARCDKTYPGGNLDINVCAFECCRVMQKTVSRVLQGIMCLTLLPLSAVALSGQSPAVLIVTPDKATMLIGESRTFRLVDQN